MRGAEEQREQSSSNYCPTSTWTWSHYFKLGQAHPIARDFIIHPFILIME